MDYRVEVADRPEGLYAVREGQVFHAKRSTADGTVLLTALPEETSPADFDTERQGTPAKVIAESEAETTFRLHTLARYDDEYYRMADGQPGEYLTLRWTGNDESVAAQLGLQDGSVTVDDVDRLTALWQERRDRPSAPRSPNDAVSEHADRSELLRAVGNTLRSTLPQGWERAAAQFRQVGDYSELEVRAVGADATGPVVVAVPAPAKLGELFTRLRTAMYEKGNGTWMQGTFTLDTQSRFDFDFDLTTEPRWRLDPSTRDTVRAHDVELQYFPRERVNVPQWLAAKAALPVDISFRYARVVESHTEGHPPVVNRSPVSSDETPALLAYLYRAPVVVSRQGMRPDIFAPMAAPDVPDAFHSDGTWIWPAAVPHYLRKYGLPPTDELLAHIRAAGHRPPYVDKTVRAAAQAELDSTPAPPANDPDIEPPLATRIDRGQEPTRGMLASQVLDVLHRRLVEHDIPAEAYEIGAVRDGAWCLRRTADGWEVAHHADGAPSDPQYFEAIEPAARALLGTLLLYPGRSQQAEPTTTEQQPAEEWPISPARGEPPLTFLHHKRMVTLAAGTVLRRFGNATGNLVYPEHTEFAETSLAPEREHEQHALRVLRPVHVLTGVSFTWAGVPGGAVAYLLPQQVGHHIESGALERC